MTESFSSAFVSRQAAPDGYLIVSVSVGLPTVRARAVRVR